MYLQIHEILAYKKYFEIIYIQYVFTEPRNIGF